MFDSLPAPLLSVWQAPTGELFAVGGREGQPLVLRHDRNGWWSMDPGTTHTLWWVYGFSATHVYAVGERGTITYFGGTSWQVLREEGDFSLWGMWGTRPADLWAVGGDPTGVRPAPVALHYTGGDWNAVTAGLPDAGSLFKVWGTSANDVLVVGERGTIARWKGSAFSLEPTPVGDRIVTVAGRAGAGAWAVGGLQSPFILHSDGGAWLERVPSSALPNNLSGVAVGPTQVVSVGWGGTIMEDDGVSVRPVEPITSADLHAVAPISSGGFVAVGGYLFSSDGKGVLLTSAALDAGPLQAWPHAGRPLIRQVDAGIADAGAPDAGRKLDPGEDCGMRPSGCGPRDECWLLIGPNVAVCTRTCVSESDCTDFGAGACCQLPGPQVTTPVCVPRGRGCFLPDGG